MYVFSHSSALLTKSAPLNVHLMLEIDGNILPVQVLFQFIPSINSFPMFPCPLPLYSFQPHSSKFSEFHFCHFVLSFRCSSSIFKVSFHTCFPFYIILRIAGLSIKFLHVYPQHFILLIIIRVMGLSLWKSSLHYHLYECLYSLHSCFHGLGLNKQIASTQTQ